MPIYEYHCNSCQHEFELMESMDSATEKACPECGAVAKRKISAPAFHLKGTGWYTSDYKCKAKPSDSGESPSCAGCPAAATK
ncbi:MAG: zinc ribbon domain-containing protein [Deferribacteraceae bacterium]|jgi:putative FmdB family regulatory protein|nr:zinc ribbon domain-containing protein [Deferribacteraceae bacterium]